MVYIILICIAVPMLLLMTLLDRRSRWLLGFMLVGMVVASSAYEINTTLQYLFGMSATELSVRVAPVVEEILKAFPVLFYAVSYTHLKGSMSLILNEDIALVGDAIIHRSKRIYPPFANDEVQVKNSLQKLLETNCQQFLRCV